MTFKHQPKQSIQQYQKQLLKQCELLGISELSEDEVLQSYESYLTIAAKIQASSPQSISLTDYIQSALYEPSIGYYSGRKIPLGEIGDFITAPEIDNSLGKALAKAIMPSLSECQGQILECGAGTGELAVQIISELNQQNIHWNSYHFLDVSPSLKQMQRDTLNNSGVMDSDKVKWIDRLPEGFTAVVIGNEILDAIPAHFFQRLNGQWLEQRVVLADEQLELRWSPLQSDEIIEWLKQHADKVDWQEGVAYEVAPWRSGWINALASQLHQGAVVLLDYGYSAEEFFHPQRSIGTAKAFLHHRSHNNLLHFPGIQDITSHVNFSELCLAGESSGLSLTGFATQSDFLVSNGVLDIANGVVAESVEELGEKSDKSLDIESSETTPQRLAQSQRLQKLLLPGEMGEVFKVIAFTKNISENAFPHVSHQLVSRL